MSIRHPTQSWYILWFCTRHLVQSSISSLRSRLYRSAKGPVQDSLHQIYKCNRRFHRYCKANLKYFLWTGDYKATFWGPNKIKLNNWGNKVHLNCMYIEIFLIYLNGVISICIFWVQEIINFTPPKQNIDDNCEERNCYPGVVSKFM